MCSSQLKVVLFVAIVASIHSQEDCPNPAMTCPDNCAGQQCGRFLNAYAGITLATASARQISSGEEKT